MIEELTYDKALKIKRKCQLLGVEIPINVLLRLLFKEEIKVKDTGSLYGEYLDYRYRLDDDNG